MKKLERETDGKGKHSGGPQPPPGVQTLLGEPKKAILKLAVPMMVAMATTTFYNVADAYWVSLLGADELSAVGFFFPFLFILMALSTGLGTGGGASISRSIGAKNKKDADSAANHSMFLMVLMAIVFTFPLFFFARQIFIASGAGDIIEITISYAQVMFAGTAIIFFSQVANAILRAEGDAKRAMYAMTFGSLLNIILDPIFIFTLGFGIAGAAWATLIAMGISSLMMVNWLFIKKDTYTSYSLKNFNWDKSIIKDIFRVGLPAMVMQISMALTMLILNIILVGVGGNGAVAVYSAGWRVVTMGILPLIGIATAVVSVTGAAFGAKDFEKLDTAYLYSIKVGLAIACTTAVLTFVFAAPLASVFTQSKDSSYIRDDLITFFKIVCIFYPGVAFGMFSSSMFQGVGKGMNALAVTLWRTIILVPPLTFLLINIMDMGLVGVWWGLVMANLIGSMTAFTWARLLIRNLKRSSGDLKYGAETVHA